MTGAGDTLRLSAATTLTIVESTGERLEVEAAYEPGGSPPPNHLHPDQDEHFEVLEGAMQVRIEGREEFELGTGETLDVPRDTPHTMWNGGSTQARLRWVTTPAGRTEGWFRAVDSIHARSERGEVEPQEYVALLEEYTDVFRLVLD